MSEDCTPQATITEKCGMGVHSVQRILTENAPTAAEVAANRVAGKRIGREPKASPELVEKVRRFLADPTTRDITAIEVFRRANGCASPGAGGRCRSS